MLQLIWVSTRRQSGKVQTASSKLTTPVELTIMHLASRHIVAWNSDRAASHHRSDAISFNSADFCRLHTPKTEASTGWFPQITICTWSCDEDMFIFLDETGSDKCNSVRRYGYSLRGRPLVCQKLLVRGKRISAIVFMSTNGILDCTTVIGMTNCFTTLYRHPTSYAIWWHKPSQCCDGQLFYVEAVRMIQEVGALVLFLPSYSPDYNPMDHIHKNGLNNTHHAPRVLRLLQL